MTPEELQATLAVAKLTMVRYRNALMAIRLRATKDGQADIARLAAKALREPDADR